MLRIRIPNPWHVLADERDALPSSSPELLVNATPRLLLVDILEYRDHLLIQINLPGALPQGITASLFGNVLSVAARLETIEGSSYLWRERPTGLVSRAIPLPGQLEPHITSLHYGLGVLTVRVDKNLESHSGPVTVAQSRQRLEFNADSEEEP